MRYNLFSVKGFTLLEILVALAILGIFLTILFKLLNQSLNSFNESQQNFNNFLYLDNKYKLQNLDNITIITKDLKNYGVKIKIYKYKNFKYLEILK